MARKKKKNKVNPNDAQVKARKKESELSALPPRTSTYDKKSGVHKSGATKHSETKDEVTYQWTEDTGGKDVKVKRRMYMKDHAKARYEGERTYSKDGKSVESYSWTEECGNHCKINKEKFDEGYDEIFGSEKRGAVAGKYKKFKKKY